jgi:hypothetical protein
MTDTNALWWSLAFLLIGTALAALGVPVAPWLAFALSASVALWLPAVAIIDASANRLQAQARFCTAYNAADPETRAALGLKYPTLRIGMNGEAKVYVNDSGVELKCFRRLMLDSDPTFISPASHWGDRTTMRKQWQAWKLYLLQEGDILQDRGKITETWKWKNADAYWRNMVYVSMKIPIDLLPEAVEIPAGVSPLPAVPDEADILAQFD